VRYEQIVSGLAITARSICTESFSRYHTCHGSAASIIDSSLGSVYQK